MNYNYKFHIINQAKTNYNLSYNDYYPYGMLVPKCNYCNPVYRYGFQGQEKDNKIKGIGNSINYKFRMYSPRVGRFFAVDPKAKKYPNLSSYIYVNNNPINNIETDSRCFKKVGDEYVPCAEAKVGKKTKGVFGYSWTITKDNGWQLTNGADPSKVKYTYIDVKPTGDASYYEERYKKHIEEFHTRPPDYYLAYGYKYLRRFKNETRPKLSPLGKEWSDETAVELQVLMNKGIKDNKKLQGDNDDFRSFAYATHVPAYTNSGKIGKLKLLDLGHISMPPDFSDSVFSSDGRSQMIQMFPHILKGSYYPDGYWNPQVNPGIFKPWETKILKYYETKFIYFCYSFYFTNKLFGKNK